MFFAGERVLVPPRRSFCACHPEVKCPDPMDFPILIFNTVYGPPNRLRNQIAASGELRRVRPTQTCATFALRVREFAIRKTGNIY